MGGGYLGGTQQLTVVLVGTFEKQILEQNRSSRDLLQGNTYEN